MLSRLLPTTPEQPCSCPSCVSPPKQCLVGVSAGLPPHFEVQLHPTVEGALGEEEEQTKPGRSGSGEGGRQAGVWQRELQAALLHQVESF